MWYTWCNLVVTMAFLRKSTASLSLTCIPTNLTDHFWTFVDYRSTTSELFINFTKLAPSITECMGQSRRKYSFELVTDDNKIEANIERSCMRLSERMQIERQPIFYRPNITQSAFQYVQGK